MDIPHRLSDTMNMLFTRLADGNLIPTPVKNHIAQVGENFPRVEPYLREKGILKEGTLGDATVRYHQSQPAYEAVRELLLKDPNLFGVQ
jgi:aminoglycoside 3-N-acetyltransferase